MTKKILISANVIFTITNFRIELLKALKNDGYEVVCVANNDNFTDSSYKTLKNLDIKFIVVNVNRKGLNPIEDLKYFFSLIKIYKTEKPDVVLHFTIKPNIFGTIAAKLVKVKSINTINGLGSAMIQNTFLSKVLKKMYMFSLKFSDKVFFQNNDDLEFFISNNLVSKNKIGIVPGSGVDTNLFKNCVSSSEQLTFLLVARLLKDKGIYEYINAIRIIKSKYKNVKFLLAGQLDNDNPSAIDKTYIKEWDKEGLIEFLGKTNDIKKFLRLTDIVVLPSYREGLSRFLIEAASASKPIITTNVAGCKDVVEATENGFLCNVRDSKSLAFSIERMILLDKKRLQKMGLKSQEIAKKKFDKEIVNKIYLKAIINL